jgi:hypothetical protein
MLYGMLYIEGGGDMRKAIVIAATLTLLVSTLAFAGNNPDAKVAVHVRPHNAKAGCTVTIADCHDIVTTEPGYSADAFPVFYDLVEYLGCEYGLTWPTWTYSAAWNNCADLVIGSIVWPGDGASHTWLSCKTGVCVPSFVWLYADGPGMVCPSPHPVSGIINVLDCAEGLDDPVSRYCAGLYGLIGDDPCLPNANMPKSWGGIKSLFE